MLTLQFTPSEVRRLRAVLRDAQVARRCTTIEAWHELSELVQKVEALPLRTDVELRPVSDCALASGFTTKTPRRTPLPGRSG